jgi:hypothetical protein
MTVYILTMYACVTINDFTGALMSKTCEWHSSSNLYRTEIACDSAGKNQVGHPYCTDIANDAMFENYRCYPQSVSD